MGRPALTPWLSGTLKPARHGWYDVRDVMRPGATPYRLYFNGSGWVSSDKPGNHRLSFFGMLYEWRGRRTPAPSRGRK